MYINKYIENLDLKNTLIENDTVISSNQKIFDKFIGKNDIKTKKID